MKLVNGLNSKIKKMNIMDIGMIKWSVFFFTIILVKLFPQLLNINYAFLSLLTILFAAKPLYKLWIKKE